MDFPPLPKEPVVKPEAADRLKVKTDQVVREVERLETELHRLGIRTPQFWRR
jgi:hypothetical protein